MDTPTNLGSGARRIRSHLELDEDIYAMLFVACLNSDYHFYLEHVMPKR